MTRIVVRGGQPLRGSVTVPGDKSVSHRALIFAGLARGECSLQGLSSGEDVHATRRALAAMGVSIADRGEALTVHGVGLRGLRMPQAVIDCGNSGTTMRLLCGLLSAQHFGTRLVGDASLSKRPMARIVDPLRSRGAHIAGRRSEDEHFAPISIAPLVEGEELLGIEYAMPMASAQVKSALLLSGLYAAGPTTLQEPVLSRDHTERMLVSLGVPIETLGPMVHLNPAGFRGWDRFEWRVPGDLSAAAFLIGAALMVPGSDVSIAGVGVNPTRTGLLDWVRMMAGTIELRRQPQGAGGEPAADIRVRYQGALRGGMIASELLVRMVDEVPIAAALATRCAGPSEIRDAQELRVKESDRLSAMVRLLVAFGASCDEFPDGMTIRPAPSESGSPELRVASGGDHRIAMAGVVLGLARPGVTIVEDTRCIATSFPSFVETLGSLGADVALA